MKVCLIAMEIFAWGKYGGFGRSTRMIGRELVRRGADVTAVVPRRAGQQAEEYLDGIRVLGFEISHPFSALKLFRLVNADIYHSQEPSFHTFLAKQAMPASKHVVTFRDTRNLRDWWIELKYPSLNYAQVLANFLYEDNFLVHNAVRHADAWFTASKMLIPKARQKYKLPRDPQFLPSPIPFSVTGKKSEQPQVCFIARMDRRKRPQIFFELASQFPEIHFVAVGAGRNLDWDTKLHTRYEKLSNLEFRGFENQFEGSGISDILSQSWVLVNTSAREALPTTFIEASAHGCAILSESDPDGFTTNFGYQVQNGDYAASLRHLLKDDLWKVQGNAGINHSRSIFNVEQSMRMHLEKYKEVLEK